ncbi:Retrovirus-related Pol polyprotein from transposon TNT 1-94 [Gossypium australe]|uniref:Retrovirus-related Pol polyprotein from transposon TNT 1-94 n=1 Tax=Gossypium australe TaxID=47621 RepID=A0A5B6VQG9_9ROSI|nr:Retrovirus-related Pol polyprotein from transposon TNT 1-94 [Gossypium australe]
MLSLLFLHGELSEDVYVEQPRGYEKKGKEHLNRHMKFGALHIISVYVDDLIFSDDDEVMMSEF